MKILLIILFSFGILFIIPNAYAETSNLGFVNDTLKLWKVFNLDSIQDGSDVMNVSVTVTTNKVGTCYLELSDNVINMAQISDNFNCNGTNIITLNQIGSDAFEFNLPKDFTIITVKSGSSFVNFIVDDISVSYRVPTYFAEIKNGIVSNVLVAYQDHINTQRGNFVQVYGSVGIGYTWNGIIFTAPNPGVPFILLNNQWIDPTPKVIVNKIIITNGTG